jgi:hypothetical protein
VCAYCGHLLVFDDDLRLRNPTDAEIIALGGDQFVLEAQAFAKAFRDTKP